MSLDLILDLFEALCADELLVGSLVHLSVLLLQSDHVLKYLILLDRFLGDSILKLAEFWHILLECLSSHVGRALRDGVLGNFGHHSVHCGTLLELSLGAFPCFLVTCWYLFSSGDIKIHAL